MVKGGTAVSAFFVHFGSVIQVQKMSDFIFRVSPHVVLGSHMLSRLGQLVSTWGSRYILVCDPVLKDAGVVEKIRRGLDSRNIECFIFDEIPSAATSETIEQALTLARSARVEGVISVGGMKTANIGRALAALYHEKTDILNYVDGALLLSDPLPFIEVPSTMRDPFMLADRVPIIDPRNNQIKLLKTQNSVCKMVVVDPNLFVSLTKNQTNAMLLQSFCIAVEAYISTKANFFSDTLAEKAVQLFHNTVDGGEGLAAAGTTEFMAAEMGLMSCFAAGASSAGIATSIALAVNARYKLARSLVSTILLPYILEDSVRARTERLGTLGRIMGLAGESTPADEAAEILITDIRNKIAVTGLPARLKELGLTIDQLASAAEDAGSLETMSSLPRSMTSDDIFNLLKQAY
ncbi:MAG: iron-containing alcohol dehydrogenase [Spirochaetaceae bacterium]|nr:iron-containing alcohol dehydrogenase [Spirochaetaceae bacterium]